MTAVAHPLRSRHFLACASLVFALGTALAQSPALSTDESGAPRTSRPRVGPPGGDRHGAVRVELDDGRILVTGGQDAQGRPVRDTALSDLAIEDWTPAAPMLFRRSGHSAARLRDGRVLVVGGGTGHSANPEIYDPANDRWTMAGSMIGPGEAWEPSSSGYVTFQGGTLTGLADGRVLAIGANGNGIQIYDPARDQWSRASMSSDWGLVEDR